ncbi:MAG: hypothetical protein ACR2HH_09370 [Chthoniobacterales bacterium]
MSDEVIMICPELTPGAGGLADYTLRVIEQWEDRQPVRFLLPHGAPPTPHRGVEMIERNRGALRESLPAHGGRVLLQYSAYGFDRLGYPRWLLRALADWKKNSAGRLVIMFHEIWGFWPWRNRNHLVQQFHRREISKILALADAIFTSTASQAEHLRELRPRAPIELLPVGTNIRVVATPVQREHGTAVLFGLQGSRVKALRALGADLKTLVGSGRITKLLTIGEASDEERALLAALLPRETFEQLGRLPEEEVSKIFATAEFGVSAQDELSLTKSGTFMAYAAHGSNIISPLGGHANASEPICWLTQAQELRSGLTSDALAARAQNLRAWQERTSSWPMIAHRFAQALELEGAAS